MLERLKSKGKEFQDHLRTYQLALRDSRTPRAAKILLGLAIGYALMPFDLIPDFIPLIGHLDDGVIVPLLVILALKMVPEEVMEDARTSIGLLP